MAKPKEKQKMLKRLYKQLLKYSNQSSMTVSIKTGKKMPTLRGRIERAIQTLENTKK